jgi:hypothetical protein
VWERVIVVQWPALLGSLPSQEALQASRLGPDVCGLALEHLLQVTYRPIMNSRRRSTTGGWRVRQVESSRSRGTVASAELPEMFQLVCAIWDTLARLPAPQDGQASAHTDWGRVVFRRLVVQPAGDHNQVGHVTLEVGT